MHYIRVSDGQTVPRDEACTPAGVVKSGYKVRVPTMTDAALPGATIADATATLTDAEAMIAVARAKRDHTYRTAYLGDRAPTFTDAQRDAALVQATGAKRQSAALLDAGTLQRAREVAEAQRAAAYAVRKEAIRNAWKQPR